MQSIKPKRPVGAYMLVAGLACAFVIAVLVVRGGPGATVQAEAAPVAAEVDVAMGAVAVGNRLAKLHRTP